MVTNKSNKFHDQFVQSTNLHSDLSKCGINTETYSASLHFYTEFHLIRSTEF